MTEAIIILGFMLASYSVVANDSIQTLGTFLYSNSHRKWWILWLYSSSIMVAVMFYGWYNYAGDVSYDRLDKVYSKMVDHEPAEEALAQLIVAVEGTEFESQAVAANERFAELWEVYLGDNTLVPEFSDTYMQAFDALTAIKATPGISDDLADSIVIVEQTTLPAIEQMKGHTDVGQFIKWYYLLPPIVLIVITYFGLPVSTSFLILITFQPAVMGDMLTKSIMGYGVAFVFALIVYLTVMRWFEKRWRDSDDEKPGAYWVLLQWCSTAFLWSMWLIQDMANIFVYLPRPLPLLWFIMAVVWMVSVQAIIYYSRGGRIQKVVQQKTNTHDIRSATIVDLIYGITLFYFKNISNVPMSTTWVFIGLLAGREFGFSLAYARDAQTLGKAAKLMVKDISKVTAGLVISIGLAYLVRLLG